jgi:hypothetical protein
MRLFIGFMKLAQRKEECKERVLEKEADVDS